MPSLPHLHHYIGLKYTDQPREYRDGGQYKWFHLLDKMCYEDHRDASLMTCGCGTCHQTRKDAYAEYKKQHQK